MIALSCSKSYIYWKRFIETGEVDFQSVRTEIAESWRRCLAKGLDPKAAKRPIPLSPEEILGRRKSYSLLIESSMPFLQVLESAVKGSGFIITLTDPEGYVLEVLGDPEILQMAADNNYLPGCLRTEAEVGTNAIGLSLILKKAIQVTGCQHYNVRHHLWTCSSAPILSAQSKKLLGTITLSGKSIGIHQHTLGMVISAAKAIENKIAEEQLSQDKDNLNSHLDSILNSIVEGIVAIGNDGRVTHINLKAEKMLNLVPMKSIGQFLPKVVSLDGILFEEILGECPVQDREILIPIHGENRFFLLSTKAIYVNRKSVGRILILTARNRVHELIQRFSGAKARFSFDDIKGANPQLRRQVELARIAAQTDSRILLVGESGTGKELFAQAIHNDGKRRSGPFVALSCAAVPRELIEAELFGYKEGAFTGSRKGGQIGKFELADGGTLFLDEISSMPLEMQSKILRTLQENEVVRLGDSHPRKVDVRIIAATNKDLQEEVQNKNFREDLYFRLNVMEIFIPPLRERIEDLKLLREHILKRVSTQMQRPKIEISDEAMIILESYSWPGNVREFENYLERASIICGGELIQPEHLPSRLLRPPANGDRSNRPIRGLKDEEDAIIRRTLREFDGNISKSARRLRISRSTLHRRIRASKSLF